MARRERVQWLQREEVGDLGFGAVVSRESRQRLLNRDGSFNVERLGIGFWRSWSVYQFLLTTTWPRFLLLGAGLYLLLHALFALAYLACGPGALSPIAGSMETGDFARAFFFSVHTLSTIGYGHIVPLTWAANALMTLESLVGLFSLALATGLVFARFSRPSAKILFSRRAVIAPYRGIRAFEFRVTNQRRGELIELQAKVILARRVESDGNGKLSRIFDDLALERRTVTFFPLAWTVVHPIDEDSPLYGMTYDDMVAADAEFLVRLSGVDDTSFEAVHSRSSYKIEEVVWDARFDSLYVHHPGEDRVRIDVSKIHNVSRTAAF